MSYILGQVAPIATTDTVLYTVPVDKYKTLDELIVCNRGAGSATYRLAVVPSGTLSTANYWYWDVSIAAGVTSTIGLPNIRLEEGALIYVYSSTGDLSFTLLSR